MGANETVSTSITLNVDGAWTVYWGFEINEHDPHAVRLRNWPRGRRVWYVRNASNVRLVNLIIHDTGHGTYIENTAHNIEIYGWIVYNGGKRQLEPLGRPRDLCSATTYDAEAHRRQRDLQSIRVWDSLICGRGRSPQNE